MRANVHYILYLDTIIVGVLFIGNYCYYIKI